MPAGATVTAPNGIKIVVESVSDSSAVIRIGDPTATAPPCPWWWPYC